MDAVITRRCPICGQKMKINEPRDFARALREHEQSAHPAYYTQTRRLRKMIVPMLVSIVVLPFVPIIFEPALGSLLAATLSIAGFISPLAIVGLIGTRALRQAKQKASASMDQTVSPDTVSNQVDQPTSSYSDQDIVRTVVDLGRRLEISGFEPKSVSWRDHFVRSGSIFTRSDRPMMVPYDGCIFTGSQIILPESTRNKIQPEEWAPLIASELVYQRKLLEKRRLGLIIRILPLTAIYIVIPVILWQLGILNLQGMTTVRGAPTPVVVAFFEVYSGTALIFTLILYGLLGLRFNKKLRLNADAVAAGLTGKTVFLSALEKIGKAFPDIMTRGRPSVSYPPGRSSVGKRIEGILAVF